MESKVFCNGCSKFCWVFENGSPLFKGLNIITSTLASVECLWNLQSNNTKLKNALCDVVPASLA
jgi:hypothetical protein